MLEQIISGNFASTFHAAGDYTVIFIATILILMIIPYSSIKDKYRMMIITSIVATDVGSLINLLCYNDAIRMQLPTFFIYALNWCYNVCFALTLFIFCVFFWTVVKCDDTLRKTIIKITRIAFLMYVVIEPITYVIGGFSVNQDKNVVGNLWLTVSVIYYPLMCVLSTFAFVTDKSNNVTHKTICNTICISYIVLLSTIIFGGTTGYMGICFIVPQIILLYYYHSYSFDITTGALDYHGLVHYLQRCEENIKRKPLSIICVKIFTQNDSDLYIQEVNSRMGHAKFKVFHYNKTKYVYVINSNEKHIFPGILRHSSVDTVAVCFDMNNSTDKVMSVIGSVFDNMRYNNKSTYSELTESLQNKYEKAGWIKSHLVDIVKKHDLDDPRVLVYCQPIINTQTKVFDTAESLMRLQLPSQTQPGAYELIYPDEFIPIAEENNLIHTLTLIILNKVCKFIQEHNNEYAIKRISVNFSALDLMTNDEISSVIDIINSYKLNEGQIAIEITESANIDYNVFMHSLSNLHDIGITIYLDDFGTGYSNLTKVFTLPFDVVKFDKSLLDRENITPIIHNIIPTIREMGMEILHEGIETDEMEHLCESLGFDYLQGYKYSKPIAVDELLTFLNKKE